MDVKSGAGTFHIEISKITTQSNHIVLVGTIDEMDCKTLITPRELLRLVGLGMRPVVVWFLLAGLLRRRTRGQEGRH